MTLLRLLAALAVAAGAAAAPARAAPAPAAAAATTMTWSTPPGTKWTPDELSNSSFPKGEVLARFRWALPDTTSATTAASATKNAASVFKSTTWRSGYEPTSTAKSLSPATTGAADLCVGAIDGAAALVPCDDGAAALVWGSHRHLGGNGGCLTVDINATNIKPSNTSETTANSTNLSGSAPDGTPVLFTTCDASDPTQRWGLFDNDGSVEMRWTPVGEVGDMCLDVTDGVGEPGTALQLWECQGEGHANQMFEYDGVLELNYGRTPAAVGCIALAW